MKPHSVSELMDRVGEQGADSVAMWIAYNEGVAKEYAKRQFQRAFQKLQAALPIIDENGTIEYRDGRKGTYATNDLIQETILPICHRFGFTLAFSTTYPAPDKIRVTGELAHKDGYSKTSEYEARVDTSGGKTDTQGRGSVISFGHRYTTRDVLNLITRGADTDGAVDVKPSVSAEALATWPDLCAAAPEGFDALAEYWQAMGEDGRKSVSDADWSVLKSIALAADHGR